MIKCSELLVHDTSIDRLQHGIAALEKAGIECIAENGGGAGVRLRKKKK
jgi:hypothetical protein